MKSISMTILALAILAGLAAPASATDEENFLRILKKFGVAGTVNSKKGCLCVGGAAHNYVGVIGITKVNGRYLAECIVQTFDANGNDIGEANCAAGGGSIVPFSK